MRLAARAHDLDTSKNSEIGIAKAAKAFALDGVQLVCYKSINGVEHRPGGISRAFAKRIGDALRENGIGVELIGAYFNSVHSDVRVVSDGMAIFEDYLSIASELGCHVVGSETGSRSDEPWVYHPDNRTDETLKRVINIFCELCKRGGQYGACVAMEGAAGHVCWNVKTLKRAYDAIAQDNLKIIFDLYNFLDTENCGDYYDILCEGLETFKNAIHCFHIKDCVYKNGKLTQVPLGQGELDFDRILCAIRRYDENASLIIEGTVGTDIPFGTDLIKRKWSKAKI